LLKKQETRNKKQETMTTTTARARATATATATATTTATATATTTATATATTSEKSTNHPFGIGLDDDTDDSQSVYDDDDIVNGDIVISFVCAGCQDGIIRGSREHCGRVTLSNKVYCIDCVSQAVKDLDAQ
jgi:hypothetical protein